MMAWLVSRSAGFQPRYGSPASFSLAPVVKISLPLNSYFFC